MAAKDGSSEHDLKFIESAKAEVRRYGLFGLLRALEARWPDRPRIGHARRIRNNIVELAQTPTMAMPGTTLDRIEQRGDRVHVYGYYLGLTGPMGPLPLHLTEFAVYEQIYASRRPFGGFLDLLAGRMLQFFYRAWADTQPAAHLDRPGEDRFSGYVGALSGATEGVPHDAAFPAKARLHYASLFASRRSAGAIEDALRHLLRVPVRLLEYQPRWHDIEPEDRSRLGSSFATLGGDAVLGGRTRSVTDAFRVVVSASGLRNFEQLLPTDKLFAIAAEALDAFKPSHLDWDMQLEIDAAALRPARLDGRARLNWTSWLAPRQGADSQARKDVHLGKAARRIALRAAAKERV